MWTDDHGICLSKSFTMPKRRGGLSVLVLCLIGTASLPATAAVDNSMVGTWTTEFSSNSGVLEAVWKIYPGGKYETYVKNDARVPHETGIMDSSNGRWSVNRLTGPNVGKPDGGTYSFNQQNHLVLSSSAGQWEWTLEEPSGRSSSSSSSTFPSSSSSTSSSSTFPSSSSSTSSSSTFPSSSSASYRPSSTVSVGPSSSSASSLPIFPGPIAPTATSPASTTSQSARTPFPGNNAATQNAFPGGFQSTSSALDTPQSTQPIFPSSNPTTQRTPNAASSFPGGFQSTPGANPQNYPTQNYPPQGNPNSPYGTRHPVIQNIERIANSNGMLNRVPYQIRRFVRFDDEVAKPAGQSVLQTSSGQNTGSVVSNGSSATAQVASAQPTSQIQPPINPPAQVANLAPSTNAGNPTNEFLMLAQQSERKGDYYQASLHYQDAALNGGGDLTREIYKSWAYCDCKVLEQHREGQLQNVDAKSTVSSLGSAYSHLQKADKENATWYYLEAVYWCLRTDSTDYIYVQAWTNLQNALNCKQISPTLKEKCKALQHHIFPGLALQSKDLDSAMCKQMFASDYPKFVNDYNGFIAYVHSMPNTSAAVPAGPGNDEVAKYCPGDWEQRAFGPLDLSTGRM